MGALSSAALKSIGERLVKMGENVKGASNAGGVDSKTLFADLEKRIDVLLSKRLQASPSPQSYPFISTYSARIRIHTRSETRRRRRSRFQNPSKNWPNFHTIFSHKQTRARTQSSPPPPTIIVGGRDSDSGGSWKSVIIAAVALSAVGYTYLRVTQLSMWDLFPATRKGLNALQKQITAHLQARAMRTCTCTHPQIFPPIHP